MALDLAWEKSSVKEPVALVPFQIPIQGFKDASLKEKTGETAIFQMFIQQPVLDTVSMKTKFGIPDGATAIIEAGNELRQTKVEDTSSLGISPDWVEAAAFAWLAKQRLEGKPGNLPSVTGARSAVPLGQIFSP